MIVARQVGWLAAGSLVIAACGGPGSVTSADVDRAEARWAANAPGTYSWRVEGTLDAAAVLYEVVVDGGEALPPDEGGGDDPRALYGLMREAIADGIEVRATFHEQGYPLEVEIGDGFDVSTRSLRVVEPPTGCDDAEPGSATDLAAEPATWPLFADYMRWTDDAGCPVRIDVITQTSGPDHCDWGDVTFLTLGDPVGTSTVGPDGTVTAADRYVWDPDGDLGDIDGVARGETVETDALPRSVADTGYRRGDAQLWTDPAHPSAVYVIEGTSADRYVLDADDRILCA